MFTRLIHIKSWIKGRVDPLWWYGGLTLIIMRVADVTNFYITTFLVPDHIAQQDIGVILPLSRIVTFAAVPLSIMSITYLRFATKFEAKGRRDKTLALMKDMSLAAGFISILILVAMAAGIPFIHQRLQLQSSLILWIVALGGILSCWQQVAMTSVKSIQAFRFLILGTGLSPLIRLVVTACTIVPLQLAGYFLGLAAGVFSHIILMGKDIRLLLRRRVPLGSYQGNYREMALYTLPIAIGMIAINAQYLIEPWIIRQRLPYEDSAGFFMIYSFGKIPAFLMAAFMPLILPIISKRHEESQPTHRLHIQSLLASTLVGLAVTLAFFCFSDQLLALRSSWRPFQPYASLVWVLCLISTMDIIYITHSTHLSARSNFRYMYYFLPLTMLEVLFLILVSTLPTFAWMLPSQVWQFFQSHDDSLTFYITLFTTIRVALTVCVIAHAWIINREMHPS